nr:T9SS type A sorting domain-containing protein [Spirosoma luteum]
MSCTPSGANRYTISFSPQYSGATSAPISFSVVNEMLPTTSPGPYSLHLYTDNPSIILKASQTGTDGEASFVYNWLSACGNAPVLPPSFTIVDVTGVSCTSLSATSRRLSFTPVYSGATGAPISFSVVNEMLPTTSPGPYILDLYTDNPVINLRAVQSGSSASHAYNWLAACQNPVAPLTITNVTGVSCTSLSATSRRVSFTPTYSGGTGAPISFSVVIEMLPTTSPGPYTLTLYTDNPVINLRAMQSGTTASYAYNWLAACQNPAAPLTITGVTGASCTALSATLRRVSFSPVYGGGTGVPISFSVVNEMLPTTSPGPYTLQLYTDNPVINLRAVQSGSSASHAYNWLANCSASLRIGVKEIGESLRVTVLSNPTLADEVSVEISGAVGGLTLSVFDSRGHRMSEKSLTQPVGTVRTTIGLGQSTGVYLLRVLTTTQSQVVKVVRE